MAIQNLLITYAKDAESNDNSPIVDTSTEAPQLLLLMPLNCLLCQLQLLLRVLFHQYQK